MPAILENIQTVYRFNELSDDAKETAKCEHWALWGYSWGDEACSSLVAFAKHFGHKVNYSVDFNGGAYSYATFSTDNWPPEGAELAKLVSELKTDGSCQFTGYCADDDANQGAVDAYAQGVRDVNELLQCGFRSWLESALRDAEAQYSDVEFSDNCDANDMWFSPTGKVVA